MDASPAQPDAAAPGAVAIVASRYNASVTDAMLDGAVRVFTERGGEDERLAIVRAPGAFELPALAHAAAATGVYRAVVALGCIIKGETRHDEHIARAVADGITRASQETGVAIAFGVLTVENAQQARDRAGGSVGNKGEEAMRAALDAADAIDAIRRAATTGEARIRFGVEGAATDKASADVGGGGD